MKRVFFLVAMLLVLSCAAFAQRHTDQLDRGLVAVPTGSAGSSTRNTVTWRRLADEYFGVTYNLYKNGSKVASNLTTTCYNDESNAPSTTTYQVAAVVNGVEQTKCTAVTPWPQFVYKQGDNRCASGYLDIELAKVYDRDGNDVTENYKPNDAEMADLDGDGQLEIIIKRLNTYDASTEQTGVIYPEESRQFVVLDAYDVNWQTGTATLMWRIDCGPNMVSLNSTEIDVIAFDWDEDGKAEVVLRGADNMIVYGSDGQTQLYTIGNMTVNTRNTFSTTDGQYAWTHTGAEYLIYMNGQTGALYQKMDFPLKRLEDGETDLKKAWGDNYGHRSSKYFFGAPFLDGRKASLFLARGIYTRHKMMALDLNKGSHEWSERWSWNCNDSNSPWYGNGYHNFVIADVDEDGRDEIVYGSMVIDDNGKGLSTTGYGHGDAQHVGDFDPYRKGLEFFGCLEEKPYYGSSYRNATTSESYYKKTSTGDDGRALMANIYNEYPGSLGRSSSMDTWLSSVKDVEISGIENISNDKGDGNHHLNFRIYWDGDLCSEILDSPGTESYAGIVKPGTGRIFLTDKGGSMNNGSKNNPCFQGDIIGDWREEIVLRNGTNLRVFTTGAGTNYSLPCLWNDHQYRQAMVWQMMAYNQPPHTSYFVGELEGITQAPPPLTNTGRTEIANGGSITSANTTPVMLCETNNMTVSVGEGASPSVVYVNSPSWVQGNDNNSNITTEYYTHTLTGGAFTGSMTLTKQGDGMLVLPDVTETYNGNTDVWAGSLAFSGTLSKSPVWMNRHTNFFGAPTISKSLTMEYGSKFYPSAAGVTDATTASYGTANISTLNMYEGSRMVFQIDPAKSQSDQVNIGTLNLRTRSGEAWENYGPEYLKPVIEIDAKSSLGSKTNYILGTLSTLTVDGENVSASDETPIASITLEGAGEGQLYFSTSKKLILDFGEGGEDDKWIEKARYDFEDQSTTPFVITSGGGRVTTSIVSDATEGSYVWNATSGDNLNGKYYYYAVYDFSSLTSDASAVKVEFDFVTDGTYSCFSLRDAAAENTHTKAAYSKNGAFINVGSMRVSKTDVFGVNGAKVDNGSLGTWYHAEIIVDLTASTVDYTIQSLDRTSTIVNVTGAPYYDTKASKCTQLDFYGIVNSTSLGSIDNIVVSSYTNASDHNYTINAVAGGTTLATLTSGKCAEMSTYSYAALPYAVSYDGKYYYLNDGTVSGYSTETYTMGKSDEIREITYTLDESIVFFLEGEKLGQSTSSSSCSSGAYCNYYGSAYSVPIADAGTYSLETYVASRNTNSSLNVYTNYSTTYVAQIAKNCSLGKNSCSFVAAAGSTMRVGGPYYDSKFQNSLGFDYILIRKTGSESTLSKTISPVGWSTYCSPYALDFSGSISGLEGAYIVTGNVGSILTLSDAIATTVPANTGLLLKGTANAEIAIPLAASGAYDADANKLVGVTSAYTLPAGEGYVLLNGGSGVGFYYNPNADFAVGANTAYLPMENVNEAREAYFFDGITGIEKIDNGEVESSLPAKRIVNGKLLIFKKGLKFNAAGAQVK